VANRLALASVLVLAACRPETVIHRIDWFAGMVTQRSFKPYVMNRTPVDGTVPVTGVAPVADLDYDDHLLNPRTRTSESINRGKFLYETYCLVCHGVQGKGDGPISSAAGGPFAGVRTLVTDTVARRTDGYLYGVIVRGTDRWDLVNYIRTLQASALGGTR